MHCTCAGVARGRGVAERSATPPLRTWQRAAAGTAMPLSLHRLRHRFCHADFVSCHAYVCFATQMFVFCYAVFVFLPCRFLLSATQFFSRASERGVLLITGVCQTSSRPHLHILTSSHLHILTSSHSLLPPCSLALLLSCPLALLPSYPLLLFYFSLKARGIAGQCQRDGTKRNPFARNEVRSPKTEVKLRFYNLSGNP